jgi:probable addiction module antidote protein
VKPSKASQTSSDKEWLNTKLADPKRAATYLNAALQDSPEMFLKAVRKVVEARHIPIAKIAEEAGFSRESFYRMTAEGGNPSHVNLAGILRALGLSFQVVAESVEGITNGSGSEARGVSQVPLPRVRQHPPLK